MQVATQIPTTITPLNLAVAVFLALLFVDKIAFWVMKLKEKNGKVKDETKAMKSPFAVCKDDPRFQTHFTEAHDALGIVKENKGKIITIKEHLIKHTAELKSQTEEAKAQTDILREIAKNGKM